MLSRDAKTYLIQKLKLNCFFPIDKRDSHKLFEPKKKTNSIVGNWSKYCTIKENTNFSKIWIGIKWDPIASKFRYESNNGTLTWANFKYSENFVTDRIHECKYQTRWLGSKLKVKNSQKVFSFRSISNIMTGMKKGGGTWWHIYKVFWLLYVNPIFQSLGEQYTPTL